MSIERTLAPNSVRTVILKTQDSKIRSGSEGIGAGKISSNENPAAKIKFTNFLQDIQSDTSHDIDYDRIAAIQASIDAGEFDIDTESIANALLKDIY